MAEIDIVHEAEFWESVDLEGIAATALSLALQARGLDAEGYGICILACDDARIAELNRDFRDKPTATNVLSWPAFPLMPESPGAIPPAPPEPPEEAEVFLGDIAIAHETVRREAKEADICLKNHVTHLILHACLHLIGYDHLTELDAEVMESIETRALASIGIPDPYGLGEAALPSDVTRNGAF